MTVQIMKVAQSFNSAGSVAVLLATIFLSTSGCEDTETNALQSTSLGNEKPDGSSKTSTSIVIAEFCEESKKRNRGVVNSPLAGCAEQWIVDELLNKHPFLDYLELSKEQRNIVDGHHPLKGPIDSPLKERDSHGWIITSDQMCWGYRNYLQEILNERQHKRIQLAILQIEGLMALRRDSFVQSLALTEDQRTKIVNLSKNVLNEKALPIHQRLFISSSSKATSVQQLREIGSRLDSDIARLLSTSFTVPSRIASCKCLWYLDF